MLHIFTTTRAVTVLFATEALEDSVAAVAMAFGRPAAKPGKNTKALSIIKHHYISIIKHH